MEKALPPIPAKRYFTIGEVSELCGVKAYVLRYWEQEFTQLKPMKRRGNRRYYQHHEVLLIRRIRELLYDQGFTISGARNRLSESMPPRGAVAVADETDLPDDHTGFGDHAAVPRPIAHDPAMALPNGHAAASAIGVASLSTAPLPSLVLTAPQVRQELLSIRSLLTV